MSARTYLFAVQDATGRELCSAEVTVERVAEIAVERVGDVVRICRGGEALVAGRVSAGPAGERLALHRWPGAKKLAKPVTHKINPPEYAL